MFGRVVVSGVLVAVIAAVMPWRSVPAESPHAKIGAFGIDLAGRDPSVKPGDDFYAYANGYWQEVTQIPADRTSWGSFAMLREQSTQQLREILDGLPGGAPTGSNQQKLYDYYHSYLDSATIDQLGLAPAKPALDAIAAAKTHEELARLLERPDLRLTSPLDLGISADSKDPDHYMVSITQSGLGLPDRDYYTKDDPKSVDLRKGYLAHVRKMFEFLGDKPEAAAAEAQTVMRIETALAKGSMTRVERRDPKALDHRMTSGELEKIAPSFQWHVYFAKVGMPSLSSLNVSSPGFFKTMSETLDKENLADWKIYLRWHLVHSDASHLSAPFLNENFAFYGKTLRGQEVLQARWKRCTEAVDGYLGEALGEAYVKKYFSPEAKERALKIVKEIQMAMEQDINSLPWMSAATKQQALAKLHGMANKIGYPDHWRDYSKLEIVRGDEMGNVGRARKFEFDRQLAKIGKPVDRGEWGMTPPTVNA